MSAGLDAGSDETATAGSPTDGAAPPRAGEPAVRGAAERVPATMRSIVVRSLGDAITTIAAALTFYALLFVAPAAVAVAAILSLVGAEEYLAEQITRLGDYSPEATDTIIAVLEDGLRAGSATTGETVAFVLALAVAVYAASRYVGGMTWAAAIIRDAGPPPPFLHRLSRQLLVGLAMLVLLTLAVVVIGVSLTLTATVGEQLGLGRGTQLLATTVMWLLFLACGTLIVGVLYGAMPGSRHGVHRLASWGSFVGTLAALVVSVGFAFWVDRFADYGRVYGILGTAVALLTWLWLVNLSLLVGLEVDAALDRRRRGAARA